MKDRYTELAEKIVAGFDPYENALPSDRWNWQVFDVESTIRAHFEEQPDNNANLESAAQQFQKELLENSKHLPAECQMTEDKFLDIIGEEQPDEGMEECAEHFLLWKYGSSIAGNRTIANQVEDLVQFHQRELRRKALIDMMHKDEEDGLYEEENQRLNSKEDEK